MFNKKAMKNIVKNRIICVLFTLICSIWIGNRCDAVTVTLLTDEYTPRPLAQ